MASEIDYEQYLQEILMQPARDATPAPQMEARTPVMETPVYATAAANPIITSVKPSPNVTELKKNQMDDVFDYINMEELPLRDFYPVGTKIKFRELKVKEIEAFSSLDESNLFDFKEKLNYILECATIFIRPDGTMGSYTEIMDGDKAWILYTIREKTFPNGRVLTVRVPTGTVDENNEEVFHTIDIRRENIEVYREEEIMEQYNPQLRCLVLNTTLKEEPYLLAPPTIGLRHCFDQYLRIRLNNEPNERINEEFFRMVPFTQPQVTYLSYEDLETLYHWFTEELTPDEFDFFYDLFENFMLVGIRGLKKKVGTAIIRSRQIYPNSTKSLFVLPNAFRLFRK